VAEILEDESLKLPTFKLVKVELITERFAHVELPSPNFSKLLVLSKPGSPESKVGLVLNHWALVPLLI
jgi:hypothetical protein